MERIIQDVLTLARDRDVAEPNERVDLETIAATAWDTVDTSHATLELEDRLPTVIADPDRLQRLFENLFRNAVEHGPTNSYCASTHEDAGGTPSEDAGGDGSEWQSQSDATVRSHAAEISVTVGRLDAPESDGFYVADDGSGIPADRRDRVFEPGYSTDEHGTGLGLAIVTRIVARHGWSISATTSSAGGARFDVDGIVTP